MNPRDGRCRLFIVPSRYKEEHAMADIPLDQQATLIDLDGTAPFLSTLEECVKHFNALKPSVQVDHRILLTRPVPRKDRPTRTWILNPDDIAALTPEQG
jgi:hypothetical protein